ncbi:hypothetical protein, partial [Chromohalobacter nigrandesensis]|uniref:hypothetical protein n=1 Tax=Chromohalobacter nigrandesensis TaxID=119863 RepID=UPI001FF377D9
FYHELDDDPLISIPELFYDYKYKNKAERIISQEFDRSSSHKIVVIDPYVDPRSIQQVTILFASLVGRELYYLTNYNQPFSCPQDGCPHQRRDPDDLKSRVNRARREVLRKELFKKFEVLPLPFPFHDRYLLSIEGGEIDKCLMVGSSLNMFLKNKSSIVKIDNFSFKKKLFDKVVRGSV